MIDGEEKHRRPRSPGGSSMKPITLFALLILLSMPANAEGAFMLQWGDIFPMCAIESAEYSVIRCGCEFLIPNFHLGLIYNMFANMLTSFFLVNDISNFINLFTANPVNAVGGILSDIADTFIDFFLITPENDTPAQDIISGLFEGILSWLFGVITPFMVLIMLLFIEFIKTYLLLAIPFMLWTFVLQELNLMNESNNLWGVYLAVAVIVAMFFGTLWLLGSDLGLYSPLIIW